MREAEEDCGENPADIVITPLSYHPKQIHEPIQQELPAQQAGVAGPTSWERATISVQDTERRNFPYVKFL